MHWKTKARIQRMIASLPDAVSYPLYYQMQRWTGSMRNSRLDPTSRLVAGFEACRRIAAEGGSPLGGRFFEVGTGWRINFPIACWLCGADSITTVDLNRYLKPELLRRDLHFLRSHHGQLTRQLYAYRDLIQQDRWTMLAHREPQSLEALLSQFRIRYLAPADASRTNLPDGSIDYHVSNNTLEHIPRPVLEAIFREAARITHAKGLLLHRIDHSDHFAHSDSALSRVNFLVYSDQEWSRLADNRYAYVNRLREEDYSKLFEQLGYYQVALESEEDPSTIQDLEQGIELDARFNDRDPKMLARLASYYVLAPPSACQRAVA